MDELRIVVFDVDGTLIDSEHNIVTAMTEAWAHMELGVPDPADVRRIIGLSLVEACQVLLPWAPGNLHRAVAESYKEAFRALRLLPEREEPLFPGVRAALEEMEAAGWLLGLATGKSLRGVHSMLDSHALHGRFVTIQTADDNPGKPNPGMLLRAAAETGVDVSRMVMIGDTAYDMQMARSAKVAGLGVSWGYHGLEELHEAGAALVVDSFENLADIAASLIGKPPCA
ncbi:HAD family hydrolase [Magnetospirillum sulfuroxidans]|uniref:HAD family hydrolase n=1 Tax=Magnetospirillum sulfuroxidans TaxID=611300 RepID=A0ABS5IEU3_9PROT|nr:HAD family hydrolase [Magnetospirillum sulfuroxidans]MBR9972924.1 HAD family hydrolase [Magnetospirillum sulfuroxidans]